ncbi:MAG: hypothetical protein KAT68_15045 [Bacteroidales bacterium]|nr:hypothetical protein [Bacteroidales bacterium]
MNNLYKSFIIFFNLLFITTLNAQVTFIISSLPDNTTTEDIIYIAGNFNSWNPGHPDYALQLNDEGFLYITSPPQTEGTNIEFKFTRGSWETVEKSSDGKKTDNREFTFGNGDTVHITIYNWANNENIDIRSTAAENVSIVDTKFYIPQLDRYRRIWIYLPPGYDKTDKHYPVLYMHDGQNVFDASTSYLGEWEVDETLNNLAEQGYKVPIVVAIDNGCLERFNEYSPWQYADSTGGFGDLYIDFIVETLKPHIDSIYRTFPDRENTGIMGSSMGGLISAYGALKMQDVFSKAGIFSPSYSFSDSLWTFVQETRKQKHMKLYQIIGSREYGMSKYMLAMHDTLLSVGFEKSEVFSKVIKRGKHNEELWKQEFSAAYLWLFSNFTGSIH